MSKITIKLEVDDADMPRLVAAIEKIAEALDRREEGNEKDDTDIDDSVSGGRVCEWDE